MTKFGAINRNVKDKISDFLNEETQKQIKTIKIITVVFFVISTLMTIYNIAKSHSAHAIVLKDKRFEIILKTEILSNLQLHEIKLNKDYEFKVSHTVEPNKVKKDISTLFEALTVTELLSIQSVDVEPYIETVGKTCYNKSNINVLLKSSDNDTYLYDDVIRLFTESFLKDEHYLTRGIDNGKIRLEYLLQR